MEWNKKLSRILELRVKVEFKQLLKSIPGCKI